MLFNSFPNSNVKFQGKHLNNCTKKTKKKKRLRRGTTIKTQGPQGTESYIYLRIMKDYTVKL